MMFLLITLPVSIPDEERNLNLSFKFLCAPPKGFMKALKAFIKPIEAPQRSEKIKIKIFILMKLFEMHQRFSDIFRGYRNKILGENG